MSLNLLDWALVIGVVALAAGCVVYQVVALAKVKKSNSGGGCGCSGGACNGPKSSVKRVSEKIRQ